MNTSTIHTLMIYNNPCRSKNKHKKCPLGRASWAVCWVCK
jgi:hypothetical protein